MSIPPIPPPGIPPGIGASGSGISVINASVVNIIPATDAAFSTAALVTLAGSTIPHCNHVAIFITLSIKTIIFFFTSSYFFQNNRTFKT